MSAKIKPFQPRGAARSRHGQQYARFTLPEQVQLFIASYYRQLSADINMRTGSNPADSNRFRSPTGRLFILLLDIRILGAFTFFKISPLNPSHYFFNNENLLFSFLQPTQGSLTYYLIFKNINMPLYNILNSSSEVSCHKDGLIIAPTGLKNLPAGLEISAGVRKRRKATVKNEETQLLRLSDQIRIF